MGLGSAQTMAGTSALVSHQISKEFLKSPDDNEMSEFDMEIPPFDESSVNNPLRVKIDQLLSNKFRSYKN